MKKLLANRLAHLVALVGAVILVTISLRTLADTYADPGGVPRLLPFRGHLESGGAPVVTAVTLEARIYDAATGGALLWGPETHTVTPADGDFTLMLGESTALPPAVVQGGDAWVAIAVDGVALAGRQRLASVAYALRAADGVPSGTVNAFGGAAAPEGWVLCDGRALDGDDPRYAALFAALGTVWGDGTSGDGASAETDFNVPDLRGRTVVGAGTYTDPTAGATTRALGQSLGEAAHVLTVAELAAHTHGYGDFYYYDQVTGHPDYQTPTGDDTGTRAEAARTTSTTGGNAAHNNMQPSAVLSYVVKL